MANRQRSSVRRWAQLALGAAIVMHGIAGFPTPQDADPNEAAADTQYFPHTHRVVRPNPPPPPFPWHLYEVPDWLQPTVYDDGSVYDPMMSARCLGAHCWRGPARRLPCCPGVADKGANPSSTTR